MKILRTLWLSLFAAFIAVAGAPQQASAQAQSKPNILFIMGDDIGFMQPSIYHRGFALARHPTSIASAMMVRCSPTTTPSRAARPGAMPSSPACIRCAPV